MEKNQLKIEGVKIGEHYYFTSDRKIKEGDWVYSIGGDEVLKYKGRNSGKSTLRFEESDGQKTSMPTMTKENADKEFSALRKIEFTTDTKLIIMSNKLYSLEDVKYLLKLQRHECQIERNKRSVHIDNIWYVSCEDVLNAEEPPFTKEQEQPNVSGSSPLSEDTIDKMNCLLGYLHLWLREKDTSLTIPDKLESVVKEIHEWLLRMATDTKEITLLKKL